jgi:hypothetical protein
MSEKIEIIIKEKEGKDGGYHAYIRGDSDFSGDGKTPAVALGNLLKSNQEKFGVSRITTISENKTSTTKKKSGGIFGSGVPGTGISSSLPPKGW